MKKILFITTRDPFSGKFSGDVIRSAKIINFLKKSYNIDVVFLGKKDRLDTSDKSVIEFKHPNFFLKFIFCIISFFKLKPIQFGIFFSPKLKKFVKDNAHKYDVLFFYHIRSSQYFPENFKGKTVLEMGDLYSKNYKLTAENLSLINPFFYFYFLESILVKIFEKKTLKFFDKIVLFSKSEIKTVKNQRNKIVYIPESVESIQKIYKFSNKNFKILFVGNLKYLPNKIACFDFAKKILPKILKKIPSIEFHIVGDIRKIDKFRLKFCSNVKVYGQKKILKNHIKGSICGLANLKIASGVQGKVLTYMSYGLPALCSKNIVSNFSNNVISYKNNNEMIKNIINLKENKNKSLLYSKKSILFLKNLQWKKVRLQYLKNIKSNK